MLREHDPYCAGLLVLGQGLEGEQLAKSFAAAYSEPFCKGFAVGRSIYREVARRWLSNEIDDEQFVATVAENYEQMISLWQKRKDSRTREGAAG